MNEERFDDVRRPALMRHVGKAAERGAVTARHAVSDRSRSDFMLVRGMRDGIQRKGKQQARERCSQPLRGSLGQIENAHAAKSVEDPCSLRQGGSIYHCGGRRSDRSFGPGG